MLKFWKGWYLLVLLKIGISLSGTSQVKKQNIEIKADTIIIDTAHHKKRLPVIPFAFYTPETSLGLTLNYARNFKHASDTSNNGRTSSLLLTALYTLNNQWAIRGEHKGFYEKQGWVTFNNFQFGENNGYFYGVGAQAASEHEEYFKSMEFFLQHLALKQIRHSNFYVGYGIRFQYLDYQQSDDNQMINNPESGLNGASGGWNNGLGIGFMFDSRDNNMYPTKGFLITSSLSYYNKVMGSDFQYGKFKMNAAWYQSITTKSVFAINTRMEHNGNDVPFFAMPGTVSGENLRGYYLGRPRDKSMLILQAEYRRNLYKRMKFAVFGGSAWVANEAGGKYKFSEAFPMAGAGIRLPMTKDGFMLRIDLAIGKYGQNVYVGGGEAF